MISLAGPSVIQRRYADGHKIACWPPFMSEKALTHLSDREQNKCPPLQHQLASSSLINEQKRQACHIPSACHVDCKITTSYIPSTSTSTLLSLYCYKCEC
eukprot:scaffold223688_cov21-Prasinocladus_malaysianus.AAC.1